MAHSKLYIQIMNSREWQRVRNEQLYRKPYCEECQRHNLIHEAQCVHHEPEVESGRTEQECWDIALGKSSRLVSLCFKCHNKIHTDKGSHTKAGHKQRAKDRLEQFKSMVAGEQLTTNSEQLTTENNLPPGCVLG